MRNDTPYNILASFAYLNGNERFCKQFFGMHHAGHINAMLDSGAFSIHNNPKLSKTVTLDTYCNFLDKWGADCEKYVMLDKIGDAVQTRKNYELMLDRGYNPMWVATIHDNDWEYMTEAVRHNPNICVAGGSKLKSTWMYQRFQRVFKNTGGVARIHALGYTTQPTIYQLPIASCDSSTWSTGIGSFGLLPVFTPGKGIWGMSWRDIAAGKPCKPEIVEILNRLGITRDIIRNPDNNKGNNSVARLASIYCHIKWQRYAKRCNRDYFLACGSEGDIKDIFWVIENWHNLDYSKYRKRNN